jgi:predicted nuclease of restriction endonuclease-like (RecB) superfamily
MIENKRENNHDLDSEIIFSHNYVLEFLDFHKEFVN